MAHQHCPILDAWINMPKKQPALQQTAKRPLQELPPCEGPKIAGFEYSGSSIQWLERLDDDQHRGSPGQGYVFRVKIEDRDYAIKVFKFYDPSLERRSWRTLTGKDMSLEEIAYYDDPFYNECRAYGRIKAAIKQQKLRSDIVVPCHGYLFLRDKDRRLLQRRGVDLQLDDVNLEYLRATIGGLRPRAIVKDVTSGNPGIDETNIDKVLADILKLNQWGVYNMDIRLDNFTDGKLVDFGSAQTDPHLWIQKLSDENADEERKADRVMFNEMVERHRIPIPKRMGTLQLHNMRLRRRRK